MIYKHTEILALLAQKLYTLGLFGLNIRKVSPVHPTTEGATTVVADDDSGQLYRIDITPIKSKVVVEDKTLMFSEIFKNN